MTSVLSARVSLPKLGGVAATTEISRQHPNWSGRGGSGAETFRDAFLKDLGSGTTPSALRAATPPNLGGDTRTEARQHILKPHGFSLIEVLVATAITVGVGSIVFQLFHQNERIFRDEAVRVEMQQTARMVVSQIGDDIRIAGQGIPPALGDVVLPGSSGLRLNMRAGFSTTETIVTTSPPISAALDTPLTLKVENTSGFSTGKQIFIWNAAGWLRATVDSVSGSARTIGLTPSAGSGPSVQFSTPPMIGLDEAIALYLDTTAGTVRRTTSTNTTDPGNPVWAPANEVATNVSGLSFLYFDTAGAPVIPDTPENRTKIASIEARVRIRPAAPVAGGTQPVFSLSVRAQPRNLRYR